MTGENQLNTRPAGGPEQGRHPSWAGVAICVALVVAVFAIYSPVADYGFVNYDDNDYVTENAPVRNGLSREGVQWAFTQFHAGHWHPLTWLSHMLDCQLFGADDQAAGWHHLVNVALHAVNCVLLLVVLRRMTGQLWPSLLVAALFALHPLRVESVAWVTGRKDVLSGLFFMLTLLAYYGYARRPGIARYLLVMGAFAMGLMAKPILVTVPFLLLLLDYWPLRRMSVDSREQPGSDSVRSPSKLLGLLLEKVPLLMLSVISCLVTVQSQRAGGTVSDLQVISPSWRLVNASVSYVMYLLKTLWPTNLAVLYPHPAADPDQQINHWLAGGIVAAAVLIIATLIAFFTARRWPFVVVGWLWYIGMLIPVIGLVQVGNQAWADRFGYLPLLGVYVAFSWALYSLISVAPRTRIPISGLLACTLVALAIASHGQVAVWKDSRTLFKNALAVTANNVVAHNNLGIALVDLGRYDEAVVHHRLAIQIRPESAELRDNLGFDLYALDHVDEAIACYREALRLNPKHTGAHINLGIALRSQGHLEEAYSLCHDALKIEPNNHLVRNNLGYVLCELNRFEEAVIEFRSALQFRPNFAEARNNLGGALHSLGRFDEAIAHYQETLRQQPDNAAAHYNLGLVRAQQGQVALAIAYFQKAVQLKPDYAEAQEMLRRAQTHQLESSGSLPQSK